MTQLLHRDPHHEVTLVRPGLIQLVRTATPLPTPPELDVVMDALGRALAAHDRPRHVMLVDLRAARGRVEPGFETAFEAHRQRLYAGWREILVLCGSAVGALHVQRHMRDDGARWRVFTSEEESHREALRAALATDRAGGPAY